MDPFATSHFSDDALLHNLKMLTAHDCRTTAVMLTRIAEVEERRLFLKAGYPSMHGYCVHELHFSEGVAYKRVHAARAARQFPAVLLAVAEGRLHLRAVLMLAPHLTSTSADELVTAATHKTRFELQRLLAERFPQPDLPERLQAIPALPAPTPVAPPPASGPPNGLDPDPICLTIPEQFDHAHRAHLDAPAPRPTHEHSPENVAPGAPRPALKPLAPERFAFQCTFDRETHDLLQDVRALMSHEVPTGEMALVPSDWPRRSSRSASSRRRTAPADRGAARRRRATSRRR